MAAAPAKPTQLSPIEVLTQAIAKYVLHSINQCLEANNEIMLDDAKGFLADASSAIANKATKVMKLDNSEISSLGNLDQYQHSVEPPEHREGRQLHPER